MSIQNDIIRGHNYVMSMAGHNFGSVNGKNNDLPFNHCKSSFLMFNLPALININGWVIDF